jgi:hypothetical protein
MNRSTSQSPPVIVPQSLKVGDSSVQARLSALSLAKNVSSSDSLPQLSPTASPLQSESSDDDADEDDDEDNTSNASGEIKFSPSTLMPYNAHMMSPMYQSVHPKRIFVVEFLDGYTFRQAYEFFKMTLTSAPMFLSSEGITILRGNGNSSLVANTQIHGHQLLHYEFSPEYANYPGTENRRAIHVVNCPLAKFRENIKGTARKEAIRIFQFVGDQSIYIQVYGGNKNSDGYVIVKTESYEHIQYELGDYTQAVTAPNCKIPLVEFCNACSNIGKIKGCSAAKILCYPKGVGIGANSETGVTDRYNKWGECDEETRNSLQVTGGPRLVIHGNALQKVKPFAVKVPIDVIKALGKLSNLTNNGILRVYCECDNLVRLMISISYYAEMTLFLSEPQAPIPANH